MASAPRAAAPMRAVRPVTSVLVDAKGFNITSCHALGATGTRSCLDQALMAGTPSAWIGWFRHGRLISAAGMQQCCAAASGKTAHGQAGSGRGAPIGPIGPLQVSPVERL